MKQHEQSDEMKLPPSVEDYFATFPCKCPYRCVQHRDERLAAAKVRREIRRRRRLKKN